MLHAKYLFRPLTKRMDQPQLFQLLQRWLLTLLATSLVLGCLPLMSLMPLIGRGFNRIVPVADYTGRFPLSDQQLKEWLLLDTFDTLAPPSNIRIRRLRSGTGLSKRA
jgi:hypothetical protein